MAKPSTEICKITPKLAKEWLNVNRANNRPLNARTVEKYINLMKEDKWLLTHEGIAFDTAGLLADGQHRLTAIAMSGVTCEMMVTRGLSDAAFYVVGQGKMRSAADLLGIANPNMPNKTDMSALARGMLTSCGGKNHNNISPQQVAEFAIDNLALVQHFVPLHIKHPSGVAASFGNCVRLGGYKTAQLNEFMQRLIDLDFRFGNDDPLKVLYRRLQERDGKGRGMVSAVNARYRLTKSALCALLEGRTIGRIYEAEKDWGEE